jgi:enoyl-[acyl-carrier-protein] reductase (NADH)
VTEGILEGKVALVAGVANKRSIAWAIAQALHGAGATLAFTYQGERLEDSATCPTTPASTPRSAASGSGSAAST